MSTSSGFSVKRLAEDTWTNRAIGLIPRSQLDTNFSERVYRAKPAWHPSRTI